MKSRQSARAPFEARDVTPPLDARCDRKPARKATAPPDHAAQVLLRKALSCFPPNVCSPEGGDELGVDPPVRPAPPAWRKSRSCKPHRTRARPVPLGALPSLARLAIQRTATLGRQASRSSGQEFNSLAPLRSAPRSDHFYYKWSGLGLPR
jgi:hypothetical protein